MYLLLEYKCNYILKMLFLMKVLFLHYEFRFKKIFIYEITNLIYLTEKNMYYNLFVFLNLKHIRN